MVVGPPGVTWRFTYVKAATMYGPSNWYPALSIQFPAAVQLVTSRCAHTDWGPKSTFGICSTIDRRTSALGVVPEADRHQSWKYGPSSRALFPVDRAVKRDQQHTDAIIYLGLGTLRRIGPTGVLLHEWPMVTEHGWKGRTAF